MLDPFPLSLPPLLSAAMQRLASLTGLETLPLHIHEIILSALFYHSICLYISPLLSNLFFPKAYSSLPWKTKLNWDVHVVSLVQSTMISAVALYVMWSDEERAAMDWKGRVWGYTGGVGLVEALATGYFLWDLWVSIVHVDIFGVGLLAHAVSAFCVFSLGYRPFVNYYAPVFILYELSSPFLNIHWFCDKLGMTGSRTQLYNGICLLAVFFGSRLCYGTYQSWRVLHDIWSAMAYQKTSAGALWLESVADKAGAALLSAAGNEAKAQVWRYAARGKEVPLWFAAAYFVSNLVLSALNVYWFAKMIATVRKRFPPPLGTRREEIEKEIAVGRATDKDGHGVVEVNAVEVRPMKARKRL